MRFLRTFPVVFAIAAMFIMHAPCSRAETAAVGSASSESALDKEEPFEDITDEERVAASILLEADDPAANEVYQFHTPARRAFDQHNFAFLEKLASELRESREMFRDGSWKICEFYRAIEGRDHPGDEGFLADLETHAAWEREFPGSPVQKTAEAILYTSYAWYARGDGYAETVTLEGWRLFHERLQKARSLLGSVQRQDRDGQWFSAALTVALGQGWEQEDFNKVLDAAKEFDPTYWTIYTGRAYSLLPRWYGEEGEWEAFAGKVADFPDGLGNETYARILIDMTSYYTNPFKETKASWPRTKNGLQILMEKYPASVEIKNRAAYLATLAGDREMAKALFGELGYAYMQHVWEKPEHFVRARNWAETGEWE